MANLSADAIAAMVLHMNDDHPDAVIAYARHYGGVTDIDTAHIVAMDAHGITVATTFGSERATLPIAFDHELADAEDGRNTLIAMYQKAVAPSV